MRWPPVATVSLFAIVSTCNAYDRSQYTSLVDGADRVDDLPLTDAFTPDRIDVVAPMDAGDVPIPPIDVPPPDAADVSPVDAGCSSNANCAGTPATPVCNSGRCVACTAAERGACISGEYCTTSMRCAIGCAGDADCAASTSGPHCNTTTRICVQCLAGTDCMAGTSCGPDGQCHAGCSASAPCAGGLTCCAGACVDTVSDPSNCGTCGSRCGAVTNGTNACRAGSCVVASCASGYADCNSVYTDGCETDLLGDLSNCGACATSCRLGHAASACAGGVCSIASCDPNFADCDGMASTGCEADLANDANHCGACATTCASGSCGATISAFAGARSANWNFNGSAIWDTATNTAVLTIAGVGAQSGTIVYANPIVGETFTVTFDARIDLTGGSRADGLTFFIESDGPTALGTMGGGLGAAGLHGFAFELDEYNNGSCGDADSNHAGIDDLTACSGGVPTSIAASVDLSDPTIGVGDIADGVWRTVRVRVAAGTMSARIGTVDVPGLQNVALPGYVPGTPWYLGFGGGTGGLTARHEIRNVSIALAAPSCL